MKPLLHLKTIPLALAAVVIANIAGQIALMHKGLDDQPVNQVAVGYFDAFSYAGKAQALAHHASFRTLFGDGYNTPGYSVLLSLPCRFLNQPLKATRYAQILLGSMLVLLAFAVLSTTLGAAWPAFWGSVLVAAWFPFYHFAQVLYPESASIVLAAAAAAIACLLQTRPLLRVIAISLCLAALIYLKPNHVLIFPPFAVLVWQFTTGRAGRRMVVCGAMALAVSALVSPWSLWVSHVNHRGIPLTTAQGYNLYLGSGAAGVMGENPLRPSIAQRVADMLDLRDPQYSAASGGCALNTRSHSEENIAAASAAAARWRARPFATAAFGGAKVLHAFGFSLRDARDALLVILWCAAMAASLWLWRFDAMRRWCLFFWSMTAMAALQAFFFLPAQRFKTVLVDFPALVVIGLWIGVLTKDRARPVSRGSA